MGHPDAGRIDSSTLILHRYIAHLEDEVRRLRTEKLDALAELKHQREECWRRGLQAARLEARAVMEKNNAETLMKLLIDVEAARG